VSRPRTPSLYPQHLRFGLRLSSLSFPHKLQLRRRPSQFSRRQLLRHPPPRRLHKKFSRLLHRLRALSLFRLLHPCPRLRRLALPSKVALWC
jgi:hypothetical protein